MLLATVSSATWTAENAKFQSDLAEKEAGENEPPEPTDPKKYRRYVELISREWLTRKPCSRSRSRLSHSGCRLPRCPWPHLHLHRRLLLRKQRRRPPNAQPALQPVA